MFALSVLWSASAAANEPPSRDQCFEAYEGGQRLEKASKLRDAKAAFLTCADRHCPAQIRTDCTRWAEQVQAEQPSVVLVASSADGRDIVDVRVWMDGQILAEKLDGKPLEIDPGEHRFRFEPKGGRAVEASWLIRQREKGRSLSVTLGAPVSAGDRGTENGAKRSVLPYVLGGVGVVGLGMFTYFGLHGRSIQNDLDGRNCKPRCPKDEADEMDRSYLIANVSLGVGLVALGTAGYLYFTERSRVRVGAGVLPGFALGSVVGSF